MNPSVFIALLGCVLFLTADSVSLAQDRAVPTDAYKTEKDIPYRTSENVNASTLERCRLDIHYPVGRQQLPSVVWFHGGGLTQGNKSIPTALLQKGIIVIAANYRLAPEARSPEYIEDAAAAVAWAFHHVAEYGGSSDLIFVSGHSAGGYLTTMVGLDKSYLDAHGVDANRIAGMIPFSGQAITHFTIRAERGIEDKRPVIDSMAPLYHVRADAAPIRILSGDRNLELLGRYEENAYFWRMLRVAGHPDVELLELQGYDHGGMAEPGFPLLLEFIKKRSKTMLPR